MNMDIRELETADYDILENVKTAFYRLWKQKLIVILVTLIGFLASFIYIGIVGIHTNYRATASIYSAVYGSYEDSEYGVEVMNSYASLLSSQRVCERAAASLLEYNITSSTLKSMMSSGRIYLSGASSDSKSYSNKLTLVVTMGSSEHVSDIANAVAQAFTDEINDLLGSTALQVLDESVGYSSYKSINVKLYFVLFGAMAFIASAGIIFVKEFFSAYVYSVAQCEQNKEMILGMIPYER